MTNRDRILRTLQCRPADRAPFGVGIGFCPWRTTLDRWREESGIRDLSVSEYFGFDPGFLTVPAEYGPWPHFAATVLSTDDEFVTSSDYRGLTVRNRRDAGSIPEFLDHPVKTRDDWERYKADRLRFDARERLAGLENFAACARRTDAPVQVGAYPWGVFGTPRDLLGAEELLVGFYTQPDLVRDMMHTYTDLWLQLYTAVAETVQLDHIHIWGSRSRETAQDVSNRREGDGFPVKWACTAC